MFQTLRQWLFGKKINRTIRNRRSASRRSFRPLAEQLEVRLALATIATYDDVNAILTFTRTTASDVTVTLINDFQEPGDSGNNQVRFKADGLTDPTIAQPDFFDSVGGGEFITTISGSVNLIEVDLMDGANSKLEIGSDWDYDIEVNYIGSTDTITPSVDTLDLSDAGPQSVYAKAPNTIGFDGENLNILFTDLDNVVFGSNAEDQLIVSLEEFGSFDVIYKITGPGAGILDASGYLLEFSGLDHADAGPVILDVIDTGAPALDTLTVIETGATSHEITVSGADAESGGRMYVALSGVTGPDLDTATPNINLIVDTDDPVHVGSLKATGGSLALFSPGTGYAVGNVLTVDGGMGNAPAQIIVDSIDDPDLDLKGPIFTFHLDTANPGSYADFPTTAPYVETSAVTGVGTDARFSGLTSEYVDMETPALTILADVISIHSNLLLGSGANTGNLDLTAGTINLNSASIDTTGGDDAGYALFSGAVVLGANVTIDTNDTTGPDSDGAVDFTDVIDADDALNQDRTLTITAGSATVTFGGDIGTAGDGALADLDVTAADIVIVSSAIFVDDSNATERTATFTGAVELQNDVQIDTDKDDPGDDNNLTFTSTINADDALTENRKLEVFSGDGTVRFQGNIGTLVGGALADLDVTAAAIEFAGSPTQTIQVDDEGGNTATFTGAVSLQANVTVDTDSVPANSVTFAGTIDADSATADDRTLTVNSGLGTATFEGDIGTGVDGALADLDVTAATINLAGATIQVDDDDAAPAATVTFTGAVVLQNNVAIDTDKATGADSSVTFTSTINADNNTLDDRTLTVTAGTGTAEFQGNIGTGTDGALSDLDVTAAAINLEGTTIQVDDDDAAAETVTFTGAVVLQTNVAIDTDKTNGDDNSVHFTSTVKSTANESLVLTAGLGGDIDFDGAVGGTGAPVTDKLSALTVVSAQDVTFSSSVMTTGAITQTSGSGTTTFSGVATAGGESEIETNHIVLTAGTGSLTVTGGGNDAILTAAGSIDIQAGSTLSADDAATLSFGTLTTISGTIEATSASATGTMGVSNTLVINYETAFLDLGIALAGVLTYNGNTGAGTNKLIANGSTGMDEFTLTGATLTESGNSAVNYATNVQQVTVNAGGDDDEITITGNPASITTVVNGEGDNDTIELTGASATSNVTANGDGGSGGMGDDIFEVSLAVSAVLNGNDGDDDFLVNAGATLTGSINGGNGADEVTLFGTMAGSIVLGSGGDTVYLEGVGNVTSAGTIDGGTGTDALDYSLGYSLPVTFTITAVPGSVDGFKGTATGLAGTAPRFDNINNFVGDFADTTVKGLNVVSTWTFDGPDSGTYTSTSPAVTFSFSGATMVMGGTNVDTFKNGGGGYDGIFEGIINGGSGKDLIDYSANTSGNVYTLSALNSGNIDGFDFIGIEALTAGSGGDTFAFDGNTASIAGKLNGGGGADTLDYSLRTTGVTVDLYGAKATGTGGLIKVGAFSTIENVIGSDGNDVIFGDNGANELSGGFAGNDILSARGGNDVLSTEDNVGGRSILIGGDGADTLTSGDDTNGDILIGAKTKSYDTNKTALNAILKEWTRYSDPVASYATRIAHIQGTLGGGLNGSYKLKASTLTHSTVHDVIFGGSLANFGTLPVQNWYIASFLADISRDRGSETKTII